ncbi:MAG: hypothetical protein ABII18_12515 [bacterium]|nr:hypothetical protein [bacterium]MBU1916638.1 hypothetical protein [bacterium]
MNDINFDIYNRTGRYDVNQLQQRAKPKPQPTEQVEDTSFLEEAWEGLKNLLSGNSNSVSATYSNPKTYHYSQDLGWMKW